MAFPFDVRAEAFEAGFAYLTLIDPVEGGPMPTIVVYPTKSGAATTRLGPFTISAGREAPPAPGSHPLIVFSHGTGDQQGRIAAGRMTGHPDAAVINERPQCGMSQETIDQGHDMVRPADQLKIGGKPAIVEVVVPWMLDSRCHEAGAGKGRQAVVMAEVAPAGAVPNFALAKSYREAVPRDPYRQRADAAGRQRRKPGLQYIADPRVRAIVLLAPALGYAFDQGALAKVHVPVRIYRPAADEMLPHPWHAERIAQSLPVPPEYQVLDRAGHFVFLAPCPWMLSWTAKQICADPPGVDRGAIHARLNTEMVTFFRQSLTLR